jgi:benzoyl-CoA reductase/2-hydroxyglutaryl-CoA dehydratase subunit BcrC/BadD/HgdB
MGRKIVGIYCAFTPKELLAAADAIPVSLCGGSEKPFPVAEQYLPANLCPLIKSSYGHAVADTCPYFHMVDFLLADATCDGKKKMFELLQRLKPLHLLLLPQVRTGKNPGLLEKELYKVIAFRKKRQQVITENNFETDTLYNRLRRTVETFFTQYPRYPMGFRIRN